MTSRISPLSTIKPAENQVSSDLDGEAVVLELSAGKYYGLDSVGTRIWHLIQDSRTLSDICDTIVSEYDVGPEECERDLIELVDAMRKAGIVEVSDEPAS